MIGVVATVAVEIAAAIAAITLHEAAHGYAARALGDDTASLAGRLSLNPLRHVDRVGTILLPGFLLISQLLTIGRVAFMFGWAKPVPVNAWRFKYPRQGMALVAAAGPAMNFLLAWLAALSLYATDAMTGVAGDLAGNFVDAFIVTNLVLGLFNLLPIPPLDGGRIVVGLLPAGLAMRWAKLERAGILLVLLGVFLLPQILREFGIAFDPVGRALNRVLPWAVDLVLRAAGMAEPEMLAPDPPDSSRLALQLDGFEGPLDLLLELARAQKLDLARISILALVEQYLAIVDGARRVRLEVAADWLVMAAWLTWLKSRLLLPDDPDAAEEGEEAAGSLAARLQALASIRAAAGWLAARPQLGQDVFARGQPENLTDVDRSALAANMPGLVRSYLAAIRRGSAGQSYAPRAAPLWSVQDALGRLGAMIGKVPDWSVLERFLPDAVADPVARRAAVASTLLAGLELARDGQLRLRQDHPFGPILLAGAAP